MLRANLLTSTARIKFLMLSRPTKRKLKELSPLQSTTPSKRLRASKESGGRVGMEEEDAKTAKVKV